jgi:type III pantothenate kinase
MLLAIDIGNTSAKFGVFDNDQLALKFFIPTKRDYTADEIAQHVGERLDRPIQSVVACSVVPEVDAAFSQYISRFIGVNPRFIQTSDDFGLTFNFSIKSTGTDRLVNSFAATEKYGVPVVVISFGTATTIDVINSNREHLGGVIAPGMNATVKALAQAASKLTQVKLTKPHRVIANTTETAIRSGVIYGHIAMSEGLLKRVITELGTQPTVVATGGFAELIAPETDMIDTVDNDLTLDGLRLLSWKLAI